MVARDSQSKNAGKFTAEQLRVIREIQRIASKLNQDTLSQSEFDEHHEITGVSTAGYQFGSWNEAVEAAGLTPNESGGSRRPQISDEDLLSEILRVRDLLGEMPSERKFSKHGAYSPKPYRDRWGSFVKARAAALELDGE